MFIKSFLCLAGALSGSLSLAAQIPISSANQPTNVISLLESLIAIESISYNEKKVVDYMSGFLRDHGLTVELQEVEKDRSNIYAYKGKKRETKILLSSHLDTVPPFLEPVTFPNGTIAGRGTTDDKGSVAAQTFAFLELLEAGEIAEDDVGLLFVVGEETGGDGMRKANDLGVQWSSIIFGEPTAGALCAGHKGAVVFRVTAHGRAAHSSLPELGLNANSLIIPVLAALDTMELPSSEKFGKSTLNIGRISGGVAFNVIAESASADIIIRVAAGTAEGMKKLVVDKVNSINPNVTVDFLAPGNAPIELDVIAGFDTIIVNYGTDIPWLHTKSSTKRYLYGPGNIIQAHSATERLEAEDVLRAVRDYKRLIHHALAE